MAAIEGRIGYKDSAQVFGIDVDGWIALEPRMMECSLLFVIESIGVQRCLRMKTRLAGRSGTYLGCQKDARSMPRRC